MPEKSFEQSSEEIILQARKIGLNRVDELDELDENEGVIAAKKIVKKVINREKKEKEDAILDAEIKKEDQKKALDEADDIVFRHVDEIKDISQPKSREVSGEEFEIDKDKINNN